MKLTFLGSGSAFCDTTQNFHNNVIIEHNGKNLLVDAGSTLQCALDYHNNQRLDFTVKDIDAIFITHLHGDHIGGLEYVGFHRYFKSFPFGSNKPKLFVHPNLIDELTTYLMVAMGKTTVGNMSINDYFDVVVDDADRILSEFMGFEAEQVLVDHVGHHDSVALKITSADGKSQMFFTGDTSNTNSREHWEDVGFVFHDCEFADYHGGVHAQYHELVKLPAETKRNMVLMHSNLPLDGQLITRIREDGFYDIAGRGYKYRLWD